MSNYRFNYIITIYNKEDMIADVLRSVIANCGKNSHIYPVLDGCTDGSEAAIDKVAAENPGAMIHKVYTKNVHETLTISAGLMAADQSEEGFNITLQDDVVLIGKDFESNIQLAYNYLGYSNVGVLSFRHGVNIVVNEKTGEIEESDLIESCYGAGMVAEPLLPGQMIKRMVGVRSPECISTEVIRTVGILDPALAPYAYCNHDYGIRCLKMGYRSYVLALPFCSDLKWGGTRTNPHPEYSRIHSRNRKYLYEKHRNFLKSLPSNEFSPHNAKVFAIPNIKVGTKEEQKNTLSSYFNSRNNNILNLSDVVISESFTKTTLRKIKRKIITLARKYQQGAKRRILNYVTINPVIAQRKKYNKFRAEFSDDLPLTQSIVKFSNTNTLYEYMHHYFKHLLPEPIREHRRYFSENNRGFGEDAFHAMWWLLIREFKPKKCLEIGVYRGQVLSLWALIAKIQGIPINVSGISPFSPVGDIASEYPVNIDYKKDVLTAFNKFELQKPELIEALSSDEVAKNHIASQTWDLIYIDGSHNYEDVVVDFKNCLAALNQGGIIVMDDSSLGTDYTPPLFAFAGHIDPSRVAREYAHKEMHFLGAVGHNNIFIKK